MGVKFDEYDVSRDHAAAQEMVQLTGQMGVPVIVVDNEVIIGFDRSRIQSLVAAGSNGGTKRVRFGIKIADASKVAASSGQVSGAIVGEVSPGFLGEKAGLKEGDIITEVSGHPVNSAADMERVLAALQPGNIVTVLFKRDGETRKSEIIA